MKEKEAKNSELLGLEPISLMINKSIPHVSKKNMIFQKKIHQNRLIINDFLSVVIAVHSPSDCG